MTSGRANRCGLAFPPPPPPLLLPGLPPCGVFPPCQDTSEVGPLLPFALGWLVRLVRPELPAEWLGVNRPPEEEARLVEDGVGMCGRDCQDPVELCGELGPALWWLYAGDHPPPCDDPPADSVWWDAAAAECVEPPCDGDPLVELGVLLPPPPQPLPRHLVTLPPRRSTLDKECPPGENSVWECRERRQTSARVHSARLLARVCKLADIP